MHPPQNLKNSSKQQSIPHRKLNLVDDKGQAYEIPMEGSLGLLALGYSGIMPWRQKRHEVITKKIKTV